MHIFVKYIHTLINGNPQGAMLAIQNIVLGQLALQIYNLIKTIFQTSYPTFVCKFHNYNLYTPVKVIYSIYTVHHFIILRLKSVRRMIYAAYIKLYLHRQSIYTQLW
jgi:hypothetical protein